MKQIMSGNQGSLHHQLSQNRLLNLFSSASYILSLASTSKYVLAASKYGALPKLPRLASSCASAPLVPLFVAARARGQGLDGCLRSLANLECFHIFLTWNNIFFLVNTKRKSGKLQVMKSKLLKIVSAFQPCQTQRRKPFLIFFPCPHGGRVPCARFSREKERKKIRDKARALAQGSNMQGIRNPAPF